MRLWFATLSLLLIALFVLQPAKGLIDPAKRLLVIFLAFFLFAEQMWHQKLLSLLFFLICISVMEKIISSRRPIFLFVLPILFCLWSNLHGGFPVGLAYIGIFLAIEIVRTSTLFRRYLENRFKQFFAPAEIVDSKLLFGIAIALICSTFAVLINPYGTEIIAEIWRTMSDTYGRSLIQEWRPASLSEPAGMVFYLTGITLTFFCLYLSKRVKLREFFILLIFFPLGCSARRHTVFFVVYALWVLIDLLSSETERYRKQLTKSEITLNSLLFVLITSYFITASFFDMSPYQRMTRKYPFEAMDFIAKSNSTPRLFNDLDWGGFIIWKEKNWKVFIDGRMVHWNEADHSQQNRILKQYVTILRASDNYSELLDTYRIDTILIPPESKLAQALYGDAGNWKLSYRDRKSAVFFRNKT